MNEHFPAPAQNQEAILAIQERLQQIAALVDANARLFKPAYKEVLGIRKDLLPRAVISAGDAADIKGPKGPTIVKILMNNGMKVQYGSLKVFLTHARHKARAKNIEENQAQAGMLLFLEERVGTEAAQALMAMGKDIFEAAPKDSKRASIRDLPQPKRRQKTIEELAPTAEPVSYLDVQVAEETPDTPMHAANDNEEPGLERAA